MTDLEKLLAIEEIKQLKARYFQSLDTKDWAGFQAVFTPDAVMDMREAFHAVDPVSGEPRIFGEPALLAGMDTSGWLLTSAAVIGANAAELFANVCTVHQGLMPQIRLLGAADAEGVWAMEDLLRFAPGGPIQEIRGIGHYFETYRRLDAGWRIHTTRITRLRIDVR
jgi:hypothetical protein